MSEWILIIFLWVHDAGTSMKTIEMFPTEISCEVAGQKIVKEFNNKKENMHVVFDRTKVNYVCVQRGK